MIARDEWLKALNEAGYHDDKHDEESITIPEFSEMMGISRVSAERRLKLLVEKGMAKRAYKRTRRSDGKPLTLPSYRLLVQAKKGKSH